MDKDMTRREMLLKAGTVAAAGAIVTVGGLNIINEAEASKKSDYPYKYNKVDVQKAGEIAYENWYKNFCSYGAASGIVYQQKDARWKQVPLLAIKFGEGGIMGWGTTCGTLIGASYAISLAAGHDGKPMINELMNWYGETSQPVFEPKNPKATFKNKTTSHSPLCHVSVGTWMKAEGKALGSKERKDRCARLAASISMETARMLNAYADGKYKPVYTNKQAAVGITSQNNCDGCHGDDVPMPPTAK